MRELICLAVVALCTAVFATVALSAIYDELPQTHSEANQ